MRQLQKTVMAECRRISPDNEELAKFDCKVPLDENKDYKSIALSNDFNFNNKDTDVVVSPMAIESMENIQEQTSDNFEQGISILTNTELKSESNNLNFKLKGNLAVGTLEDNEVVLSFEDINTNSINNVTCLVNNLQNSLYELNCTSDKPIKADLNGVTGVTSSGKQVIIKMKDGEENTLEISKVYNSFNYKTNSNGLSGGAIAAIVLVCVAVLVAISVTILMLRKKSNNVLPQETSAGINLSN